MGVLIDGDFDQYDTLDWRALLISLAIIAVCLVIFGAVFAGTLKALHWLFLT